MEQLYRDGRIKAIGVSNFLPHHLEALMDRAEVMPMVNQLEINPRYHQTATAAFCRENGILVESWGPLARGGALEEPILRRIADKHGQIRRPDLHPLGAATRHRASAQIRAQEQNPCQSGRF